MMTAIRELMASLLKKSAKNTFSGFLGLSPENGNVMMSAKF
jgi:hypothetical protein